MRSESPIERSLAAPALALLLLFAGACATRQTAVDPVPAPGGPATAVETTDVERPAEDDQPGAWTRADATAGMPETVIEPGEGLSKSPLDELAEAEAPELSDVELADARALAAADEPEFDIPMVINDDVLAWIDYYANQRREQFLPGMRRSGRYVPMFRQIFAEAGLPLDLVYMAQVESAFKTNAYSRARAMGIWQFISSTAVNYGLKIDSFVDERRDPEKSARAAAAYLKKLYGDFGDWHLAMAAYNGGEGRIGRALAKTDHDTFWDLAETRHIKRETRNYVPAILAAILIYKDPAKYGLEYEPDAPLEYDSVEIDGAVDLQVLADCAGVSFEVMEELNPMLRRGQTPPHTRTDVRVPPGLGAQTLAALERVPASERVLYVHHRVRSGDTLSELARKYDVSVGAIQQANALAGKTMIRVGQDLVIPTVAAGRYAGERTVPAATFAQAATGEAVTHRVRHGDTLSRLARQYGTTPAAIAAASGIAVDKTLQIGERLTIVPGASSATSAGTMVASSNGSAERAQQHRVRRGESLWAIAQRYGTTVASLCSMNAISSNATLYPGTLLTVSR